MAKATNPFFPLFHPRSVAVIGASGNPLKMGYQCVLSLKQGSFPGRIYPVHPQEKEILGLAVFTDVRQIPDPVDLAMLVVPAAEIFPALEACQRTVRCLLDDRNMDALIVFLLHHPFMTPKRIAGPLLRRKQKSPKPIVLCANSPRGFIEDEVAELESRGIPVYPLPERTVRALKGLFEYGEIREIERRRERGAGGREHRAKSKGHRA